MSKAALRSLSTIATAILVLCAITTTALLVHRELWVPSHSDRPSSPHPVADWRRYAMGGHRIGTKRSDVSMIVFSDFECPACQALYSELKQLAASGDSVAFVFRHYPSPNHPFALSAALAADCAGNQNRFEAYHDVLFRNHAAFGTKPWIALADSVAIPDRAAFAECVARGQKDAVIDADTIAGHALGIVGTPTLVIDGLRYDGVPPVDDLRRLIKHARHG